MSRRILLMLYVMVLLVAGCRSTKVEPPADAPVIDLELSAGYALLHELVSKQSGLGRALILGGGMSDSSKQLIRDIEQASKQAAERIKSFAEADPSIRLGDKRLPEAEQGSRDAIESRSTRRLLFAGKKFELRLLLTQADATEYGSTLADAIVKLETQPARRDWLRQFAEDYAALNERVEQGLAVRTGP